MQIYEALKKDHEEVRSLLTSLLSLNPEDESRESLIKQIRDALIPHARAEEAVFYNSLRSLETGQNTVMHAYREHIEAETLLKTLQVKDKVDADWKTTAQKLKDALEHHIQEEETTIFNQAKMVLSEDESRQLGEAFIRMKSEVRDEGFLGTTLDLIANLMPPRFTNALRGRDSNARGISPSP